MIMLEWPGHSYCTYWGHISSPWMAGSVFKVAFSLPRLRACAGSKLGQACLAYLYLVMYTLSPKTLYQLVGP